MCKFLKEKAAFFILILMGSSIIAIGGCDDSGITPTDPPDSNVEHFDSIGVTDGIGNVMNGINLLLGTTVPRDSTSKDVQLVDSSGTGSNFILRSGDLSDLNSRVVGFQTRFNRIYASMTPAQFDTITVIPDSDTSLNALDFTADDTYGGGAWGYFNANINIGDPLPVYSFWLKGKSESFTGVNVFGILIPREASNSSGTFRMSFEVKINTSGKNNFVHSH
jgi:hypothetical protein